MLFPGFSGSATTQPKQHGIDFAQPIPNVRAAIGNLPEADRPDALRQWADSYVASERKSGGGLQTVGDRVRNVAQGFPILGSYADELNALTQSGLHKVTGGSMGAPYDETKAYNDATDRAVNKDATHLFTIPTEAASFGVLPDIPVSTADAARIAGGAAAFPALPAVNLIRGNAVLPATVNTAATGAVYGGLHGTGEGNSLEERQHNALVGAGVGGGLGAVAQPIVRGVSNLATATRNGLSRRPEAIRGYSGKAVDNVTDAARNDGLFERGTPNAYRTQANRLGNEGTLADMGPNLASEAGGIASLQGPGKTRINSTLGRLDRPTEGRRGGAAARIEADADLVLGPPVNLVEAQQQAAALGQRNAAPHYDAFYATEIRPSERLITLLQGVPNKIWTKVRELAQGENVNLNEAIHTGRGIDLIKRGLDDYVGKSIPGSNEERIFSSLTRNIVSETDRLLSPANPAQSPWALGRAASGEWKQFNEGVAAGQKAFKSGTHPHQMQADLADGSPMFRSGYEHGARGEVRDIIGQSATNFGPNGDSAARRALGSEYARDKIDIITRNTPLQRSATTEPQPQTATNRLTGQPENYTRVQPDRLTDRLDTESVFEATRQKVLGNSVTAERTAAQKRYASPGDNDKFLPDASAYGDAKKVGTYVVNKLTGNFLRERAVAQATDAAEMLMAQGMRRDEVARALAQHARSQDVSAEVRRALNAVGLSLMTGVRQNAISERN